MPHYSCNHVLHAAISQSNKPIFKNRNQHHFMYCPIYLYIYNFFLLLVLRWTLLIYLFFFFIYLFIFTVFSLIYSLFLCCIRLLFAAEKLSFPDRDHLNSPSSLHKVHLSGSGVLRLLLGFTALHLCRLSSSASQRKRCPAVTPFRGANRQRNELWHRPINIILIFQAVSLD